jgi:tetratricopeptide (TPR) repeat protein
MNATPIRADEPHPAPQPEHQSGGIDPHLLLLQAAGDKARARVHAVSGKEHYLNCQYGNAIAEFEEAIRLDPESAEAHNGRGLVYYAQADLRRAIAGFEHALSLDPELADAYYNRGCAMSDRGEHERAIADFDRALAIDPGHSLAENRKWVAKESLPRPRRQTGEAPAEPRKKRFGLF